MDVEMNRAEAEVQQEESALQTEFSRLAAMRAELEAKVREVRQVVADAADHGARDAALSGRLETPLVALPGEDALGAARAARLAALQARRQATAQLRQQLAAARQHLVNATLQLQSDEQAARQLLARGAAPKRAVPPPPPPSAHAPPPPPPNLARRAGASPAQRVRQRVPLQTVVDFESDHNFFNGFSANISDGGLFVATVNVLPIGTEIDLTFTLPSGVKIQAHGIVRWVRDVSDKHPDSFPGIGIQFTQLDDKARVAVEHFLASREPMFYAGEH